MEPCFSKCDATSKVVSGLEFKAITMMDVSPRELSSWGWVRNGNNWNWLACTDQESSATPPTTVALRMETQVGCVCAC